MKWIQWSGWVVAGMLARAGATDALSEEATSWRIGTTEAWRQVIEAAEGIAIDERGVVVTAAQAELRSKRLAVAGRRSLRSLVVEPSVRWRNWQAIGKVGPTNLEDAPVFLTRGEGDYWLFGLYGGAEAWQGFESQPTRLDGVEGPLWTTPFARQVDGAGGRQPGLGGYHAWQSPDMVHWIHHGPVTETFSRWVTTAEVVGDQTYLYYDYPNDQDPHLYIDADLTDGKPGKNVGMAFHDPSHGSDCAVIRDREGRFHLIYEDWTPINARRHSWDSPLAGHAVGRRGYGDFEIRPPVVDARTQPTGEIGTYRHPHWKKEHPDWDSNVAEYEVHRPRQDAFGDWAAIAIGEQVYLFGDDHPAHGSIRIGWFTATSLDGPFERVGALGAGHPDPDIGFAEGRFYLINQTSSDYVSPGPWVGQVEARAGVDVDGDGVIEQWTAWTAMAERYQRVPGFAKQIDRQPARLDTTGLPAGRAFTFELRAQEDGSGFLPEWTAATLDFAP